MHVYLPVHASVTARTRTHTHTHTALGISCIQDERMDRYTHTTVTRIRTHMENSRAHTLAHAHTMMMIFAGGSEWTAARGTGHQS